MFIWMASYLQPVCQHISFVRKLKMYFILIYSLSEFWGVYICSFNKIFWFISSMSSHIFLCPRKSLSLLWFLWMFGLQREDFEQIVEGPYIIYNCDRTSSALTLSLSLRTPFLGLVLRGAFLCSLTLITGIFSRSCVFSPLWNSIKDGFMHI